MWHIILRNSAYRCQFDSTVRVQSTQVPVKMNEKAGCKSINEVFRIRHCLFFCKPNEKCMLYSWYVVVIMTQWGILERVGKWRRYQTLTCFLLPLNKLAPDQCNQWRELPGKVAITKKKKEVIYLSFVLGVPTATSVTCDCDVRTQLTAKMSRLLLRHAPWLVTHHT
jgi:hypothetical protein